MIHWFCCCEVLKVVKVEYTVKLYVESGSHINAGSQIKAGGQDNLLLIEVGGLYPKFYSRIYRRDCVNNQVNMKLMNSVDWKSPSRLRSVTY